jgi:hypothetical protein
MSSNSILKALIVAVCLEEYVLMSLNLKGLLTSSGTYYSMPGGVCLEGALS